MEERKALVQNSRLSITQLQFLRFFMFMNIFLWHGKRWVFWDYPLANACASSVSFFIVLSGLLSGYSAGYKNASFSVGKYVKYIWKKLTKFYPVHFLTTISVLFFTGIPYAIALHKFELVVEDLKKMVNSLLLIQSWTPEGYFAYNGVSWFLSTMMFLYLFTIPVSLMIKKLQMTKHKYVWLTSCFAITVGVTVLYCYLTRNSNVVYWQYIFPPARLGEYLGGMILGAILFLLEKKIKDTQFTPAIFTVLEILVFVYWLNVSFLPVDAWKYRIVNWLAPNFLLLGVFTLGKGYVSSLFRCRILTRLGDISFYCYILHFVVIRCFFDSTGLDAISLLGNVLSLSLCLLVTMLLADILQGKSANKKSY